jgi:hypothetical protein
MADGEASPPTNPPAADRPPPLGASSWLARVFQPGIGNGVINFCRLCILLCLLFLITMTLYDYNIHYHIMTWITGGLMFSFEFFIRELRKYPEIMNPAVAAKKEH